MLTARTAHKLLHEAYPPHAPLPAPVADEKALFDVPDEQMNRYEARAKPRVEWADVCQSIVRMFEYVMPEAERMALPLLRDRTSAIGNESKPKEGSDKRELNAVDGYEAAVKLAQVCLPFTIERRF